MLKDSSSNCEDSMQSVTWWSNFKIVSIFSCIIYLPNKRNNELAKEFVCHTSLSTTPGHLSITPRQGNPDKCLSQRHNK